MAAGFSLSENERLEFSRKFDVSRETIDRLIVYCELVDHWNQRINLVSKSTIDDIWQRHIVDSAQLYTHLDRRPGKTVDLGSGAGFPGLVLAIMGVGDITLVESNGKKCAFLAETARLCQAAVDIQNRRIEDMTPPAGTQTLMARALAPLDKLLSHAARLMPAGGTCYFFKGAQIDQELTGCRKSWTLDYDLMPSMTDKNGVILRIKGFKKHHDD